MFAGARRLGVSRQVGVRLAIASGCKLGVP
jgi:hypothetical protein